ncbi:MAG: hypothetical protein HZA50_07800 [Planctomycetes bacterium]|nr:hypothetical protein [Planctomycetota bacterium]
MLEFQGVQDVGLLVFLSAAVAAVVALWGVAQLVGGRTRYGLACLAAAAGPVGAVPALVAGAIGGYRAGDARQGRLSLIASLGLIVLTAAAVAIAFAAGKNAQSVWAAVLVLQVAAAVGVFYTSVYGYLGAVRMSGLMLLRLAAVVALLMILFKPVVSFTPSAGQNRQALAVLLDRSGSMATADQPNLPDRFGQAVQMIQSQQRRIDKHFRPAWYSFARAPQAAESLDDLARQRPEGPGTDGTDIASAIGQAGRQFTPDELAGVLLVSDGIQNAAGSPADQATALGVPVWTVGVGSTEETLAGRRNIAIVSADTPLEVVANNVATITAVVRATGFAGQDIRLELLEEGSDQPAGPDAAQTFRTDKNVETFTAKLKWTPGAAAQTQDQSAQADIRRIRLVVRPDPAETTDADNAMQLHTLITQPQIKVLYVEGSIRPEYKFLKRLLETDPNVQYMGLVRVGGNNFLAQGSIGGKQLAALPSKIEEFKMFDVIILGDLDKNFMPDSQAKLLKQFVSEGGALLMLGGHSSFGPGGWGGTAVEDVLPVKAGAKSAAQDSTPFLPQLTAEGMSHPIFEGIFDYFFGPGARQPDQNMQRLADLKGCVAVETAKSGATVLAVHPSARNAAGPLVVLAVQQFGAGRSAAFTADTTWQWFLPMRALGADSPYHRFWGQLVRWLAGVQAKARQSPTSVVIRPERNYLNLGEQIKLLAKVQDPKGALPPGVQVSATLQPEKQDQQSEKFPLTGSLASGLFEGAIKPASEGKFTLTVTAVDQDGKTLGQDAMPLTVLLHSSEKDRLARNDGLLGQIASASRGRYADISALPDLLDQIIQRQQSRAAAAPQIKTVHLYNFTVLFLVFVCLLTAEWLLRRAWQLQ